MNMFFANIYWWEAHQGKSSYIHLQDQENGWRHASEEEMAD